MTAVVWLQTALHALRQCLVSLMVVHTLKDCLSKENAHTKIVRKTDGKRSWETQQTLKWKRKTYLFFQKLGPYKDIAHSCYVEYICLLLCVRIISANAPKDYLSRQSGKQTWREVTKYFLKINPELAFYGQQSLQSWFNSFWGFHCFYGFVRNKVGCIIVDEANGQAVVSCDIDCLVLVFVLSEAP